MKLSNKPHIQKMYRCWFCMGHRSATCGSTPQEAYSKWVDAKQNVLKNKTYLTHKTTPWVPQNPFGIF